MKAKYLFIALLIALAISLVACDSGTDTAVTTDASTTTATASTTEDGAVTTSGSAASVATTTTATTKSGIIELPPVPVDVR